jgi:phospholipase/lecithinase/hemolysin
MQRRSAFRPAVRELEERTLPSHGALPLDPTGVHGAGAAVAAAARPAVTVGALGDSYTDEYRFYPPDRSRARNWVEILAATRGLSFGPFTTASRGAPRGQGFALNWALEGATSTDMVRDQLPGLAAQVARGKVAYAWIFIGGDDLLYLLRDVATGRIAPDQALASLTQVEARIEANFTTAVNTLLAVSPRVRLVVATLPDVSLLPLVRVGEAVNLVPPVLVNAVSQVIQRYNTLIRTTAAGNPRVASADLAAAAAQLVAGAAGGSVRFGGTTIALDSPGDGFRHFFLADGIHIGTVGQGVIADAFVEAIDARFGARLAPLTPKQIVQFAAHISPGTP